MSIESLFKAIEEPLKSRKFPLKVQKLSVCAKEQGQILQILPYLDANFLKDLEVSGTSDQFHNNGYPIQMDNIVKLDQWKKLETVDIELRLQECDYTHFTHFNSMKIFMDDLEDFEELQDNFDNPFFTKGEIKAQNFMTRAEIYMQFARRLPRAQEMEDNVHYLLSTSRTRLFYVNFETSTFTFMRPEFHEFDPDKWVFAD